MSKPVSFARQAQRTHHVAVASMLSAVAFVLMYVEFPIPALIGYAVAILIIALTKYISLGSMSMLTVYAILVSLFWSGGDPVVIIWACTLAILCILRHRANIQRLINGTENKFGQRL